MVPEGQRYGRRHGLRCDGVHTGSGRCYLSRTRPILLLRSLLPGGAGLGEPDPLGAVAVARWGAVVAPAASSARMAGGAGQPLAIAALAGPSLGTLLRGEGVTFHLPAMGKWVRTPACG